MSVATSRGVRRRWAGAGTGWPQGKAGPGSGAGSACRKAGSRRSGRGGRG